jgi:benzoate-CoA ligase
MLQFSSADHSTSPPRVSIPRQYNAAWDLVQRNLQAGRAGKIAYIDDHGSYTFGDLAERVNRFGNVLNGIGLEQEDRVMLCLLDTIDFPTTFLGSIQAGVVPIAANTLLTTADYDFMLGDSRAKALVVSKALWPQFALHRRQAQDAQARDHLRQRREGLSQPGRTDDGRQPALRTGADHLR